MSAKLSRFGFPFRLAAAVAALAAGSAVVAGLSPAQAQTLAAATDAVRLSDGAPAPGGVAAGAGAIAAGASRATPGAVAAGASLDMRPKRDVDESALRYYAAQKDHGRVDAEIRRLKALYPDWTAPEDLWTTPEQGPPDETALWDLFSQDRMDELKAVIDARKKAEPGWEPSRDLDLKIRRKVARRVVIALWNEKKWKELVAYAQSDPMVAEIGDVDILWSLAEGFANAKQKSGALAIYTSILTSSTDPAERIGTVHKAIAFLQMADVEKLVAMGKKDAEGKNEFDVILVDIVRARISAYLHDERKEEVIESDLKVFQDYAKEAGDPNQPGLVAWYRYKRQQFKEGLDWFKLALSKGGDSMIAHGLAHALRELGHFRETEEVAFAWREKLINNRILYVDILERDLTREIPPYVETERLARYGRLAAEDASGEAAQALAWYAYNSCQFEVALEWFERAMAWLPKQETVYGYALTLRRLKRDQAFLEVVNRADGLHPKVVELVFPEERYRPPTPCEISSWEQARWWEAFLAQNPWVQQNKNDAVKENSRPLPGRQGVAPTVRHGDGPYTAGYDGFVQNALHDPLGRYSWGVVTGPTGKVYPQWRPEDSTFYPPVFNQIELPGQDKFPLAVLPENPLRFAALPGVRDAVETATKPPAATTPAAASGVFARDPYPGPYPIIARRVADVGSMPYEKFGGVVLPNPDPGKPLGAAPTRPGESGPASGERIGADAPLASKETTGSLRKRVVAQSAPVAQPAPVLAAPAPGSPYAPAQGGFAPAAPVFAAPPLVQQGAHRGALPVTPPPGMTWATPPELQAPGAPVQTPGMAGMSGMFGMAGAARMAIYGQAGVSAIYAPPAPQIYAPQQIAPQQIAPAPEPRRRARRAAPQPMVAQPVIAQPAMAAPMIAPPAQGYVVPVMPATGGAFYGPPPPTSLRMTAAPAVHAPGYAAQLQPVMPQQIMPQQMMPQPAMAQPVMPHFAPAPPQQVVASYAPAPAPRQEVVVAPAPRRVAPRHRRVEVIAAAPAARYRGGSGGGSCSLGASGTAAEMSPQRAVASGWCLVNARRPAEAAIAFDRAIAAGGKTAEEAAYGKSIALIQSNDPKAAAAAAAEGGVRGKRRDDIGKMATEQRVYQSYDSGDYRGALRLLRQRQSYAAETRDLTLMRGWSHYQLGDLDEAKRIFRMLDDQMSTKQSRSGLAAVENKQTRMAY
jgi:tetratricopeptide (TPR) repeat protein